MLCELQKKRRQSANAELSCLQDHIRPTEADFERIFQNVVSCWHGRISTGKEIGLEKLELHVGLGSPSSLLTLHRGQIPGPWLL
eukprot:6061353-Amphidinium_carterae.1